MSVRLMAQILDHGPKRQAARFVMLVMADYANDEGHCWPSIPSVADKACMSERSAYRVINELISEGWLEVVSGGGRGKTNRYMVRTNPDTVSVNDGENPDTLAGNDALNPDICALNPDTVSPKPSLTINRQSPPPIVPPPAKIRFDAFWAIYPRRVGKGAARKAWDKAMKRAPPDLIIERAAAFGQQVNGTDPKYIPHPATWLNGDRWEDDPEPANHRNGASSAAYEREAAIQAVIETRKRLGHGSWG